VRTAGLKTKKVRVSLARLPTKGYGPIWTTGSEIGGSDYKRGRKREGAGRNRNSGAVEAMAGGKNLAGVC
jgi:hypothetical protein